MTTDLDQRVRQVFEELRCQRCGAASFQPNTRCRQHPTKEYHMSFSVTFIGKPDAIKRKLNEESARLTDQSKAEFDAIKPALETILDQIVGGHAVSLSANGHATFEQVPGEPGAAYSGPARSKKTYGACQVEVKTLGQIAE